MIKSFFTNSPWHHCTLAEEWAIFNNTNIHLTALCLGLPGWASTRKVKSIWIYWSKRQWVAVASAGPHPRQITMPAPHHSVFYRPDEFPTVSCTEGTEWAFFCTINVLWSGWWFSIVVAFMVLHVNEVTLLWTQYLDGCTASLCNKASQASGVTKSSTRFNWLV